MRRRPAGCNGSQGQLWGVGQLRDRSHDEAMTEVFQADPSYGAVLLADVVREGNTDELAILERQLSASLTIIEAHDSLSRF